MVQSVNSFKESFRSSAPGVEFPPGGIRWLKKKSIKKVSFSINPSNSGKSTQETDKDMNNKKIAYLANPTDKEDVANK